MVWVYDSPFNETEQRAYDVLRKKLKSDKIAEQTVKLISLTGYVKNTRFGSPQEIQTTIFYDKERKKPVFNETLAKNLFDVLKTRGGASNYPFTDYTVRQLLDKLADSLPEYVVGPFENMYNLFTAPVAALKENIPLIDLALTAGSGASETGITAIGDLAKTFAGPMGAAIAAPLMAVTAALASLTSMAQRDFGQSTIYIVTAIPFIGALMVKAIDKVEKQVSKIRKYPDIAAMIPFINGYVASRQKKPAPSTEAAPVPEQNPFVNPTEPPQQNPFQAPPPPSQNPFEAPPPVAETNPFKGGKRFSTRKRTNIKRWQKTKRNKSART